MINPKLFSDDELRQIIKNIDDGITGDVEFHRQQFNALFMRNYNTEEFIALSKSTRQAAQEELDVRATHH